MTIFFEVMQALLIEKISSLKKDSLDKANRPGRDLVIAKAKQDALATLISSLKNTTDTQNDKSACDTLTKQLHDTTSSIKASLNGHNPGTTENELAALATLVTTIYKRFDTLGLLNTQPNPSPHPRTFYYFVAEYEAFELDRRRNKNVATIVIENMALSNTSAFEASTDTIIQRALESCRKVINEANGSDHYQPVAHALITSAIDALSKEYSDKKSELSNPATKASLAITGLFYSPTPPQEKTRDTRDLLDYLILAKQKIYFDEREKAQDAKEGKRASHTK